MLLCVQTGEKGVKRSSPLSLLGQIRSWLILNSTADIPGSLNELSLPVETGVIHDKIFSYGTGSSGILAA